MKFMLLIYGDEQAAAQASAEQTQQVGDAYEEFTQSIVKSGNFLDGDPFMPTSTSKSVRVTDGGTETTDGPECGRPRADRVLQGPGGQPRAGRRVRLSDPRGAVGLDRGSARSSSTTDRRGRPSMSGGTGMPRPAAD